MNATPENVAAEATKRAVVSFIIKRILVRSVLGFVVPRGVLERCNLDPTVSAYDALHVSLKSHSYVSYNTG